MNINALKKIAGLFDRSAGIGTARDNKIDEILPSDRDGYYAVNEGSYYGNLFGNAENEDDRRDVAFTSPNGQLVIGSRPGDPLSKPFISGIDDAIPPMDDVPQKWLAEARSQMARRGADKVLGDGKGIRDTPEWKRIYENLMHAGKSNQDEFRKNKKVHKRDAYELDQNGLGPLLKNLTPGQKKRLLQRQNIQASNRRGHGLGRIA